MELIVNGEPQQVPEKLSVASLLDHLGVERARVAVEVDQKVVPRAEYEKHALAPGSVIEIVQFVGGG